MLWLEIKLINPLPKYRKAVKFKLSFFRPHGYRIFISNRFKFTDTSRFRPFSCAAMPVWYLSIQIVQQREPDLPNINLLFFIICWLMVCFQFLAEWLIKMSDASCTNQVRKTKNPAERRIFYFRGTKQLQHIFVKNPACQN